jgi:hypothetical protein
MQIVPEALNQFWEQFSLSGWPNGTIEGTIPRCGVTYQLSSAQLLALQTTAVLLVPPPATPSGLGNLVPPAGYAFIPTSLRAEYVFLTAGTAYTIGNADNAFQIEYVGKTTALLSLTATGLVDQTASTIALTQGTPTANLKISVANAANLGLEVKLAGTTPALTLGTGSVYLTLGYTILPLF